MLWILGDMLKDDILRVFAGIDSQENSRREGNHAQTKYFDFMPLHGMI